MTSTRRQRLLFATLYFSEGAPIGFLWWALPTRLRASGVEVSDITALLAVLVLPWTFKFLLAPWVDIIRTPRWPLRAWIATFQVLMGVLLLATLAFDWQRDYATIAALLVAHAMAAAAQDVAVDAYALTIVRPEHRGSINAWMQGGMLAGRSIFGGGALLVDAAVGANMTVFLLVAAIWSSLAVLALAGEREPALPTESVARADRARAFRRSLRDVLRRRSTWLVLAFAATAGAGFESVGLLVGPFLVDQGFTQETIGAFLFLPAVSAMMAGAAIAGLVSDRIDRRTTAGACVVLTACAIAGLALTPASLPWLVLTMLGLIYVCIGALTTVSYALFMDLTDARLGATQLSAAMSATNLCESWSAVAVGALVGVMGYHWAFVAMAAASLVSLPLLRFLPSSVFTSRSRV